MTDNTPLNADDELRRLCKAGRTFKQIRDEVDCSDATIRRYMRVFKPEEKADDHR